MSISSKSINRINKAVENQNQPTKTIPTPLPEAPAQDSPTQKNATLSRITQELPDYLL